MQLHTDVPTKYRGTHRQPGYVEGIGIRVESIPAAPLRRMFSTEGLNIARNITRRTLPTVSMCHRVMAAERSGSLRKYGI
jgi:hypothetical protein